MAEKADDWRTALLALILTAVDVGSSTRVAITAKTA